uniref:Rpl32 n=1 Tax=Paraboea acutifolia TaxID=656692 RepID=A0A1B0VP45_9LAMI|nr:rpl32 [Paraboea acutifolia]
MAVPKKRTSVSKKRIRKFLERKGYCASLKAFSLGKSFLPGIQKVFLYDKQIK